MSRPTPLFIGFAPQIKKLIEEHGLNRFFMDVSAMVQVVLMFRNPREVEAALRELEEQSVQQTAKKSYPPEEIAAIRALVAWIRAEMASGQQKLQGG